jgi:enoyl-CoA hydratase/carnithine racemase
MQTRKYALLLAAEEGGVATLTLNKPERRNAIGPQMVNELLYALKDAMDAPEVRSIVITGAGKAFCAGGDFAQMTAGADADALPVMGDYPDLLLALLRAEKPVIAKVNGHAMGGGLGIVAACTFAIASTEAELATPEINVGLFPMMIMAVLSKVVPRRRLLEMMIFGERMKGDEAAKIGLVNRAVAPAELDAAVKTMTDGIAGKSPITVRLGLQAFAEQDDMAASDALPMLRERLGVVLGTDDAREGLMAFLEKRQPKWTGKLQPYPRPLSRWERGAF